MLPKEIAGSFSFDENEEEEDKLINIEARDSKWVLYSTTDVKVLERGMVVESSPLIENSFYVISRNQKQYLIHVTALLESDLVAFSYDQNINLLVGNTGECNAQYQCPFLKATAFRVKVVGTSTVIERTSKDPIYRNDVLEKEPSFVVREGDVCNLYGLKIVFLKGLLLMNKVDTFLTVNEISSRIQRKYFEVKDTYPNIEARDMDLYNKEDYFSKSPRIRRVIETKKLKISEPPKREGEKELPMILTLGPMLTMGVISMVSFVNTLAKIISGSASLGQSWPQLLTASAMLCTMLVWPNLTRKYNKKLKEEKNKEIEEKYQAYLHLQEEELLETTKLQKEILIENLISVDECLKIIQNRTLRFWDKRIDQNDFLVARIGIGNEKLDVDVNYPEEGFTLEEDDLRKALESLIQHFEYIENVPLGYSFYESWMTAIMGEENKSYAFIHNILLQFITFYSYEDVKLVIFTNEKNKNRWDFVKYLNHNFTNNREFRFFASNAESRKELADFLEVEVNRHLEMSTEHPMPPYYLIVIDDYEDIKRYGFIKVLTESEKNIGFSLLFLENRLSRLPSRCNNFITLGDKTSGILKNSYENQEQSSFIDEIKYDIDMMSIARQLSNIPIEFEKETGSLPNSISFLEMEKVGKVEQLNILNRWNTNDSTTSLKAEVGVDEQGKWMNLDLHEKYHGPHGLIAGMTGSGKSEFIITYILSMAINYSPDDVVFILIDYKGGGLAFAFENKVTGISLPHLAGTITNLDKAEMDRTLVSIDSEIKRRQRMFNEVRDKLGESTIDIYKYQRFYKEGKIDEPIPHLFIVCDEFAELKSQQPDFMDNLISIARIGRSLGVHLILATQKPTGVVNDQIWSNSKFHVCLKVQDASDSNEMLKRPDAANLKQTGRFYLQVGYDEYFALGQSAWCGAKYFPSDRIVKQVDKSVNFINDNGYHIKNIQFSSGMKTSAKGEQLSAIMDEIIATAKKTGKFARKLWLENIPPVILVDQLYQKYEGYLDDYALRAIVGEYDAPERQEQGLLIYDYVEEGNTAIYGMDGSEYEMILNSIIYSTIIKFPPDRIQFYILDFGSQGFRRYEKAPHVGGVVCPSEEEKYQNFFKLLKKELDTRKKILSSFGSDYKTYVEAKHEMPLWVVILNNFDSIMDNDKGLYDTFPEYIRDSERFGIVFILTATGVNSIARRISQNINNNFALKLKDANDYALVFSDSKKLTPRDIFGRGIYKDETLHEFQTASIVEEESALTDTVRGKIEELNQKYSTRAVPIPILPEQVLWEHIASAITGWNRVPIGIDKASLTISKYDFTANVGTLIASNKLKYITPFARSLIEVMKKIPNTNITLLDPLEYLSPKKENTNWFASRFEEVLDQMILWLQKKIDTSSSDFDVIYFYGMSKILDKIVDKTKLVTLFELAKKNEKTMILVSDDIAKLKNFTFEKWYQGNFSPSDGIFVGKGVSEQTLMKISNFHNELTKEYPNNIGFRISESSYRIVKLLEFEKGKEEEEE